MEEQKNQENNNNIYCYLRVSTEKQDLNNNKGEILLKVNELNLNSKNIIWIEEIVSGMKIWKSRELGKIQFNKGDVFITSELSRVGRTMTQIMGFISNLMEKGVKIYFTKSKFNIDGSINSQVLIFAYSLCSQIERELIATRTRDALQNKKNKGEILGRPKNKMILDNKVDEIKKQIDDGIKLKVIAKKYNSSQTTITKLIKKHNLK